MDNCYINLGAVKAKEIDGELYVSCWNFSKALAEKEREISDLCKENDELGKQISELESELTKKETLLIMREEFCEECKEKSIIEKLKATPLIEEPLPFSSEEYEEEPVKINLNDNVKVKLTPYGAEIYYHQYDELNKQYRRTIIEPHMPKIDKDGYTKIQLHNFMNLYGEHIRMCNKNVIEPLDIILCD